MLYTPTRSSVIGIHSQRRESYTADDIHQLHSPLDRGQLLSLLCTLCHSPPAFPNFPPQENRLLVVKKGPKSTFHEELMVGAS